jgi:hypothetical protein
MVRRIRSTLGVHPVAETIPVRLNSFRTWGAMAEALRFGFSRHLTAAISLAAICHRAAAFFSPGIDLSPPFVCAAVEAGNGIRPHPCSLVQAGAAPTPPFGYAP